MADEPEEPEAEAKDAAAADGEGADAGGEGGEDQTEGKKAKLRLSPKKLAMLAVPVVLLLGAGGYFAYDHFMSSASGPAEVKMAAPKVYYNLPEMVVNLSSQEKRAKYLKLKVSLEASNQQVLDALNPIMPRVMDMFQLYLRELRSSDLEGSAGIYRLKEELLRRVNLEIHPYRVSRVLFNEIIVQ